MLWWHGEFATTIAFVGQGPSASRPRKAEESSVTEYPVSFVRDGLGAGLPRKVLRTLIGQTVTSACFVLAAHLDVPLVTQSMSALIRSLCESKGMVADVRERKGFLPTFSICSCCATPSGVAHRLVPAKYFLARSEAPLRDSTALKTIVSDPEIAAFIDKFIAVEKERIEAVETCSAQTISKTSMTSSSGPKKVRALTSPKGGDL